MQPRLAPSASVHRLIVPAAAAVVALSLIAGCSAPAPPSPAQTRPETGSAETASTTVDEEAREIASLEGMVDTLDERSSVLEQRARTLTEHRAILVERVDTLEERARQLD